MILFSLGFHEGERLGRQGREGMEGCGGEKKEEQEERGRGDESVGGEHDRKKIEVIVWKRRKRKKGT